MKNFISFSFKKKTASFAVPHCYLQTKSKKCIYWAIQWSNGLLNYHCIPIINWKKADFRSTNLTWALGSHSWPVASMQAVGCWASGPGEAAATHGVRSRRCSAKRRIDGRGGGSTLRHTRASVEPIQQVMSTPSSTFLRFSSVTFSCSASFQPKVEGVKVWYCDLIGRVKWLKEAFVAHLSVLNLYPTIVTVSVTWFILLYWPLTLRCFFRTTWSTNRLHTKVIE
jgi:hypothetical protein